MATTSELRVNQGSDVLYDNVCSVCKESNTLNEAQFFCKQCYKFYCDCCVELHNQLFKTHAVSEREDRTAWPVSKETQDIIEKCTTHEHEKVSMFCEDHNHLCCQLCLLYSHRTCQSVVEIAQKSKETCKTGDISNLITNVTSYIEDASQRIQNTEVMLKKLLGSYIFSLEEITALRKKVNDYLDDIEKKAVNESQQLLKRMEASHLSDIEHAKKVKNDLQYFASSIKDFGGKNESLTFIAYTKCLDLKTSFAKEHPRSQETLISFKPNAQLEDLIRNKPELGTLHSTHSDTKSGDANTILTLTKGATYSVKTSTDTIACYITAISEMPGGAFLIADCYNNRLKLLDTYYKVIDNCNCSANVWGICNISVDTVAATVGSSVQFINVRNRRILKGAALPLPHKSFGIAHHAGDLYITSNTALYRYTIGGVLLKKLYEDTTGPSTVRSCVFSSSGTVLYVANASSHQLLTLDLNGTVLSTFSDPAVKCPTCINVTNAGQVLVCGYESNTIIQVDMDGKNKLATILTTNHGVKGPGSVCTNTGFLIVGQNSGGILVFKIQ